LSRFRVVDLSRVLSAPARVRMLADFDAGVIHIEPPEDADPVQSMGKRRPRADGPLRDTRCEKEAILFLRSSMAS